MLLFFIFPFYILNILLSILPLFTNYINNNPKKRTNPCCSSGRHGKRGRHSNRHHAWWHGLRYNKKNNHNNDSPGKKRRLLCKHERDIRQKIDLLQYFEPLFRPPNIYVIDDDVFYDTEDVFDDLQREALQPQRSILRRLHRSCPKLQGKRRTANLGS